LEGGIRAWDGLIAEGVPEAGIAYFNAAVKPEEFIALAWTLEDGSRRFYAGLEGLVSDKETGKLFHDLVTAEEHHKASLTDLYRTLTGKEPGSGFPGSVVQIENSDDVMEGGMGIREALKWAEGKGSAAILELSMSLETNSYDLYIKMRNRMEDEKSQQVFDRIAGEEKNHLEKLSELFESKI
jgi:sulfur-carrier protein adenylyltransferase/sulfurtransferase